MAWRIKFIPKHSDRVSVTINGEHALDWASAEGEVFKDVPAKWALLDGFQVYAVGEHDKTARIECWWDNNQQNVMEFDNGEEDEVRHD